MISYGQAELVFMSHCFYLITEDTRLTSDFMIHFTFLRLINYFNHNLSSNLIHRPVSFIIQIQGDCLVHWKLYLGYITTIFATVSESIKLSLNCKIIIMYVTLSESRYSKDDACFPICTPQIPKFSLHGHSCNVCVCVFVFVHVHLCFKELCYRQKDQVMDLSLLGLLFVSQVTSQP